MGGLGGETAFFKFVDLRPGVDAAVVNGADHIGGGQIDDKFAALLDERVGMALGANGDIGLRGDGVGDARPCDGDDVGLFH